MKTRSTPKRTRPIAALIAMIASILIVLPATASVDPATVELDAAPGDSFDITKTVTTPVIAPNPDIFFLADTTGSMGPAIANVKAGVSSILATVVAEEPSAQFGVGEYRDVGDAFVYRLNQAITASQADVQTAVNGWAAGGGGDFPEAQLFALEELASNAATGFRGDSSRIVVWFGDAPGHDPRNGSTEASATAALQAAEIRVIAVSTGANQLDSTGQATRIADATGGSFISGVDDAAVTEAILEGLQNLPVEVTPDGSCDDASVSLSFDPATQTVTSGTDAVFEETIDVGLDAPQGGTVTCTVDFLINGEPAGPDFTQTITIDIADVTPPTGACTEASAPSGAHVPNAGPDAGRSGQNPDGFYVLTADDNVGVESIVIADSGSTFVSDPFVSGDKVQITQAPGVTPSERRPGPGDVVSHLTLNGDAVLTITDAAGNVTTVDCLVPPPPR